LNKVEIKTKEEINQIELNGKILRFAAKIAFDNATPGVSTQFLDDLIEQTIVENQGIPTFKGYCHPSISKPFPGASCQSLNNVIVHGIPSEKVILKDGDLLSIDIGVTKNKLIADSCFTFGIGNIKEHHKDLLNASREITLYGIELIKPGLTIHQLSIKIAEKADQLNYDIIPGLYGHGTGRELHELPIIPFTKNPFNFENVVLDEGMVLTIEPVISFKSNQMKVKCCKNGWSIRTRDGSFSSQFEHTVAVTSTGHKILTGEF
jgi:methionyl aminopeptidase